MNMAFSMTTRQIRAKQKLVTRRIGWEKLQPGDTFRAIVKGMGLKKGEKIEVLCDLICVSNRREPLKAIKKEPFGATLEGFPEMTADEFIVFFCKGHRQKDGKPCTEESIVSRIQFIYA